MRPVMLICAGALVAPMDSAVNTAFPAIVAAFALQPHEVQWVILPFVLAQSIASVAFGRWGDLRGHRRVFTLGMAFCVIAHGGVTLSQDVTALVVWRCVQGVAVGMAISCAPALITASTPSAQRPRVLALYSAAISVGVILGPLLGGVLVTWWEWQGVFGFRCALSLVVLMLIPAWLPPHAQGVEADASASPSPPIAWRALLSPRFRSLQFTAIVMYLATFSILLWIPFLLAAWTELSIAIAGCVLAAFPLGSFAASLVAARIPWTLRADRSNVLISLGLGCATVGLAATAACALLHSALALSLALFGCGLGLGCFQAGHFELTLRMVPSSNSGLAGSLITVVRLVGLMVGVPALSVLGATLGIAVTLGVSALVLGSWTLGWHRFRGSTDR